MYGPSIAGVACVLIAALPVVAAEPAKIADDLQSLAEVIKPAEEELKWQQIPWVLDLAEGQQLAQQERRPIFLWVTGDDPLERC
jgi:hypothetical protein